ncbi:dual specificity protein phosphatase 8 isoform X1 [Corythoichthys intestinalis]|uniref:dual specificity protein phosphatase 8 isoform X1 n=1 Tax=Corythoichthys intestinalis TaxID=161448 RepID=UPI0025A67956|nr:dual specificity protein phosphatase 8 isoform X1 [Corythoichthys intestinalis]
MVWSREEETQRPPLSIILPRLYLGAESDVTQDRLASLGISYVLSVSRCSPRPSFLPCSRYLRIPIDDSLWDDLLPWIPQALRFIDSAMSSGASVLVHCAAGISRSPALAVAYIMYSSGMDLDHAYRFVKERRPSISPNFNFLGQLQHFQSTLRQKASGDGFKSQQLDNSLPSINIPNVKYQDSDNSGRSTEEMQLCRENFYQQRHSNPDANGNQQKLWTHNTNPQEIQTPFRVSSPTSCTPMKAAPKPTQLQLPAVSVSLSERRKSLSLSLTPLGICPPSMTCDGKQTKSLDLSRGVKTDSDAKTISRHVGETHKEQSPLQEKQNGSEVKEQGLLSPLSCTLNKLLDWGERMLLGGVFAHPVKMGQPALPYRC